MNPLINLISIQFKGFFREPAIIFWALVFPILLSWILGIAFTTTPQTSRKILVVGTDLPSSGKSSFLNSSDFVIGKELHTPQKVNFSKVTEGEAKRALRKGEVPLYIKDSAGVISFHFDPQNPEAQQTYLLLEKALHKDVLSHPVVAVTGQGNRYIDFLIPGLIAFGIMNSCLWGISYNLIEYRMKKLLRRMVATPMRKSDFLGSLILFRIIITAVETLCLLTFAYFYFKVAITGQILAFIIIFLAGVAAFSGISILVSARAKSSQVGNGIVNAITLPMMILSGVFFNYHNFPTWAVKIIQLLPLTMLADNLRAIFTDYAGLPQVIIPALILSVQGIVFYVIGLKIYKWY
ncbi:MAG TPA: ABC transporter permease [Cytophagaceae bacterium]